jgi:hypothetical protein
VVGGPKISLHFVAPLRSNYRLCRTLIPAVQKERSQSVNVVHPLLYPEKDRGFLQPPFHGSVSLELRMNTSLNDQNI